MMTHQIFSPNGSEKLITSDSSVYYSKYGGLSLITDRTQSDVDRWRELRDKGWNSMTESERNEWSESMKGAYNDSDMLRVDEAIKYITNRLNESGYNISIDPYSQWSEDEIPSSNQLSYYLSCIKSLRNILTVYQETPQVPSSMSIINYQDANDIEKILFDIDELITNMLKSFNFGWAIGIADIGIYTGV
jgi:hypothetical protein